MEDRLTAMLSDILRRIPVLTIIPLIAWALGMTVYTATWKAQTDYKLDTVLLAISTLDTQTERIVAMEQKLIFLADSVREMKETMKEKSK